ncbi:MAG: PQQ-binding-like beta-propeller repeat protein [Sedimentisphaerales bacterium]|nr:PQQ-binding-like beta-propeller repeat protein [Sedimentisphaerales bacterium]
MTSKGFLTSLLFSIVLSGLISQGQEWTRFRGPNGQGISEATTIPAQWTPADYNWKIALPGGGHSSPVIWKDKVFVTTGDQRANLGILLAVSVSNGQVVWRKDFTLAKYRVNDLNSYATATPTVDADHVYVLWPAKNETILVALDHEGNKVWDRTFEGVQNQHGAGSSPVVIGDRVVFSREHESRNTDAKSAWTAVHRKTGQTLWTLERQTSTKTSYSTPCVYSHDNKPQLIFASHAHGLTSVDLEKGTVIWEVPDAFSSRVVASLVISDGLIIGTNGDYGRGKRLIAIRPGSSDGSIQPKEAYKFDANFMPYVPTCIAQNGLLFMFDDLGYVTCLRSATGERLWRERPAKKFFGSPVWADGKLYCITTTGDVVVVKASENYGFLAVNSLGEKCHSTPAIAGGRMYVRTVSHLYSIGTK